MFNENVCPEYHFDFDHLQFYLSQSIHSYLSISVLLKLEND